jgi:predicted PurR-regulated permease PerM
MWPGASPASLTNGAAGMTVIALVIAALYFGASLFIPLALAGLLSFILQPLVRWLHRRWIPRAIAVLSVVLATTFLLGLAVSFLAREATFLAGQLPQYESNLQNKAKAASESLQNVGIFYNATRFFQRVETELKSPNETQPLKVEVTQEEFRSLATLLAYAKLTLSPLATLGLTFLFTIFILLQYYDLRDRLVYLFGPTEIGRTTQAFNEAALDLSKFFRLQAGLNLCFGIVVGIALWIVGLPNPALWGALAGVSRFVPYIGGIVAAAGPILMAAAVDPGWTMVFAAAIVILAAEVLVGYAVEPFLFGAKTRMSPLAVLTAAAFWTTIWGPVGLILALPITLAIVVFGEHVPRLAFIRVLFGNNPALSAAQRLYHLLLAGHTATASEEVIRHVAAKKPVTEYLDEVFIPAMSIATRDLNNGVFRRDQLEGLKQTTKEFVEQFKEVAEMHAASPGASATPAIPRGNVLVVAGRGTFDQAVADLTTFVLQQSDQISVSCTSLGGLTGISSAAAKSGEAAIRYLVISTVGGVTESQIELLCRRAERDLHPEQIAILHPPGHHLDLPTENFSGRIFSSSKELRNDILNKLAVARKQPVGSDAPALERAAS